MPFIEAEEGDSACEFTELKFCASYNNIVHALRIYPSYYVQSIMG